jgi:DNA-binding NtrC family response regulator
VNPRARQPIESPDQAAAILLVSPCLNDHLVLPGILKGPGWQWHKSQGCREALELLERHTVAVLLCERDQPDGCWHDLLEGAAKHASPPSLIVSSRLADEYLWAEVLNLGGYDVLIKPFDCDEVLRVTSSALRSWKDKCAELAIPANGQSKTFVSAA